MFETIRQGFTGLALFLGQWLSTGEGKATLEIKSARLVDSLFEVSCVMDMGWNQQLEELVDAGIPLPFRITAVTDKNDSAVFYRTLRYNIIDYTYTFADSSADLTVVSKQYPLIYLVLEDFRRWKFRLSSAVAGCTITAELLPSRVSRLNRVVDLSQVWGQKKVSAVCVLRK
jgi:hypothetical protein